MAARSTATVKTSASLNVPVRARPEIGPNYLKTFHDYEAQSLEIDQVENVISAIQTSNDAILLEMNLERQLFDDGTICKANPCLMSLEKTLLDLSSHSEGIFYTMIIKYKQHTVVRYFETGCYGGFMATVGEEIIAKRLSLPRDQLLPWCVYTKEDAGNYQRRKHKRENQAALAGISQASNQAKSSSSPNSATPIDTQTRKRPDKEYSRLVRGNKSSIVKQLALMRDSVNKPNQALQFCFGIVHVLKHHANPKKQLDRHTEMLLRDAVHEQSWDDAFTSYIACGLQSIPEHSFSNMTLKTQFAFLSTIPNNHWATYVRVDGTSSRSHYVGFLQHLAFQKVEGNSSDEEENTPEYYPTSTRNRILHFTSSKPYYVKNIVHRWLLPNIVQSNQDSGSDELDIPDCTEQFPKRCRRYQPRVVKLMPDMLSGFSPGNKPERSLFTVFSEQLITTGTVKWRTHTPDIDVFLLSDYSIETGHMLSSCVHLTRMNTDGEPIYHCICDTYKYLQSVCATSDTTEEIFIEGQYCCMHVRFFREFLETTLSRLQSEGSTLPATLLEKKVLLSQGELNNGVVVVGNLTKNCNAQFSVKGKQDFTCSFVNISKDGLLITCKAGTCQAALLNRRKVPSLLTLDSLKICDHLDIMKAHKEIWGFLCQNSDDRSEAPTSEGHNVDDADLLENIPDRTDDVFDPVTGLWNFGGISQHIPKEELNLTLSRCVRKRQAVNDETHRRDKEGFLTGVSLIPDVPSQCQCGAGFTYAELPGDPSLLEDYITKLYTKNAPLRCTVYKRMCKGKTCTYYYNSEKDSIHQWSKEICAGDELGWSFVRDIMKKRTSFSAFCDCKSLDYRDLTVLSAPFMSKTTFVKWFFSWAAAMRIDFRKDVDPWCQHSPKFLACDGTHVGVSVTKLNLQKPVESPDLNVTVQPHHKRYDRVFLPYRVGVDRHLVASARSHLIYLCKKVLSQLDDLTPLSEAEEIIQNEFLMHASPVDDRVRIVIGHFIDRSYSQDLLQALAQFLKALAKDAAVSNFLPFNCHDFILEVCEKLRNDGPDFHLSSSVSKYCPEISNILKYSLNIYHLQEVTDFIVYLIESVIALHRDDPETPQAHPIAGTYRPDMGAAYYFTAHGCQVRKMPRYEINSKNCNFDDAPDSDTCSKIYPAVSRGGYSYIFLWFCPVHGHSYGFHIISGSEGRKDPFSSLYKYLPVPPENIFYDFACSLSEYSLNRAPDYFKTVCIYHDIFHGLSHKCPFCFKSRRLSSLNMVNSEICEQFNSFLQSMKYTGTHLTQTKFCFFLQFFIHLWNKKKTDAFQRKREIVYAGFD